MYCENRQAEKNVFRSLPRTGQTQPSEIFLLHLVSSYFKQNIKRNKKEKHIYVLLFVKQNGEPMVFYL